MVTFEAGWPAVRTISWHLWVIFKSSSTSASIFAFLFPPGIAEIGCGIAGRDMQRKLAASFLVLKFRCPTRDQTH